MERQNKQNECKTYVGDKDECSECINDYFLDLATKKCVLNPKGVVGCRIFSDENTCTACKDNKYLSNNKCLDVATPEPVTNCKYYSS